MLTNEDVQKIIEANKRIFATREELVGVFATQEDTNELKEGIDDLRVSFDNLQSAVDSYAQKADAYFQEVLLMSRRIDRLEKWARCVGEKIGVKLEY